MRTATKAMAFASGFAMSGLEGSGTTAAAMWRSTTAAVNTAQHQTVAPTQILKPAALHTQIKQYVVTTPDAGRDNKGTSPWGFPV